MRAEILLKVEESHLDIRGRLEEVTKLLVEHEYTTVVGMLEPIVLYVLIDGTRDRTTRDQLTLGEPEELPKLLGNLLLTVEPVVLRAVRGLLASGVFLGSLNLSDNLAERLELLLDDSEFGKNSFGRHYTFYRPHIFKYSSMNDKANILSMALMYTRISCILPNP